MNEQFANLMPRIGLLWSGSGVARAARVEPERLTMVIVQVLALEIQNKTWKAALALSGSVLVLFLCLYLVSNRYLAVSLRHIAMGLSLPPDLAGMTLLAFGNGAPDFFTALSGASGAPEMILSGAVGAALFTFTIVFGLVILLQRKQPRLSIAPSVGVEEESRVEKLAPLPFYRNNLLCIFCSASLLTFLLWKRIPFWIPIILLSLYALNLSIFIVIHIAKMSSRDGQDQPTERGNKPSKLPTQTYSNLQASHKILYVTKALLWRPEYENVVLNISHCILRIVRLPMSIVLHLTVIPVDYPLENEPLNTDRHVAVMVLNRFKMITAPICSLILFTLIIKASLFKHLAYRISLCILSIAITIVLLLNSSWDRPPRWFVLHAIYAFATCLGIIYLISGELIECLRALGQVINVSPSTMGILVLAWGNSFGDLIADTTMARTGHLNIALFGVFAAHIQNVLFTLGTSFLLASVSKGGQVLVGSIDIKVYLGMGIVGTVLIASLLLIPNVCNFTLPKWLGIMLVSFYTAFAIFAVLNETGLIGL